MTFRHSLYGLVMLIGLAACTADDVQQYSAAVPIVLTTAVGDNGDLTRAGTEVQNSQFESGETFNAYFPADVTVTTTIYQTSDASGNTSCTGALPYLAEGASSATVHAYYPAQKMTHESTSFSVEMAQNIEDNYKLSDLMYATATVSPSDHALLFAHKLSKIVVCAAAGSGVTEIQEVRIVGGCRTINISEPVSCGLSTTLSDANTPDGSYITMYSGGSEDNASCAAIIPPQTISGGFLEIVTEKGAATYSLDSKTFDGGYTYTLNITVAAACIGLTTEIKNWTTSTNCTITVKSRKAAAPTFMDAANAEVGKVVGADGLCYATVSEAVNAGTDAIGIVAYIDPYNHGLILALRDVVPYGLRWLYYLSWYYSDAGVLSSQLSHSYDVLYNNDCPAPSQALADGSSVTVGSRGRENTRLIISSPVKTPAAEACVNYTPTTSGFAAGGNWFLPSMGEWNLMVKALVEKAGGTATDFTIANNDDMACDVFNSLFTDVGGEAFQFGRYWSSTEAGSTYAWRVDLELGNMMPYGKDLQYYVRPALVF